MADIQKSEATLVKKVWDIANVLASAGVGFTDYITQLTYILFLKMDAEKEELGLGSSIPEGYKWKDIVELNGDDLIDKYEEVLKELSKRLTNDFGKGFSVSNLQYMKRFYLKYQKQQTVSVKLSWSHYCELLAISDDDKRSFYEQECINALKRSFYEQECINAQWSFRELKRQIDSSLFERLLLSDGQANKEKVMQLASKGIEMNQPSDIIKDPYVLEFVGVPENKPLMESDLERMLVRGIEDFLLELGRGFMFVGTQQRVTLNNTHYYVDMVFYNKILKAYVLIELKRTKFTPEAAGQLNMYLNYYATEVNDEGDNPPIGIILCTDKDSLTAEYALGGLSNQIFASKYTLCLPNKEQLIAEVQRMIERSEMKEF